MLRTADVGTEALDRERLIDEVRAFMRRAGVREAWVYGSWARGDEREWSDVDLIVISPRFGGVRFVDRLPPLYDRWELLRPYPELLAYTPEEFEEARQGMGIERVASETGIRIALAEDE